MQKREKDGPKALLHARKIAVEDDNPYRPLTLKEIAQTLLDNELALDTARAYAERTLALSNQFPVGVIRYFPEIRLYLSVRRRQHQSRQLTTRRSPVMCNLCWD